MTLTAERVRDLLHYDPETGLFTNRIKRGNRAGVGLLTGNRMRLGYTEMRVEGMRVTAHRLAWLYVHGEWPKHEIDHIDGDPTNNRISNLRDVPHLHNMQNVKLRGSSTSGLPGAYRVRNRFKALIQVGGKQRHLGYFDTAEEANAAYMKAKAEFHPGFAGAR
jgi:hypothetical protein